MSAGLEVRAQIVGVEAVKVRFIGTIPKELSVRLRTVVTSLGAQLERLVKSGKLEGQVLHRRTGRLVRSINTRVTSPGPETFTARTGTRLKYGRFWELGFHGIESVRAHVRRVSGRNVRARVATISSSGRLSSRAGARSATGVGFVRAHSRRVDQAPRPFLKPSLNEMRPTIRREIQAVLRGL